MNTIVNSKHFNWSADELSATFEDWVYVGRGKGELASSPLGNPYKAWLYEDAVARFRVHLWKRMQAKDDAILNELAKIGPDTVLVCHCDDPDKCHASIIAKAAAYLESTIEP